VLHTNFATDFDFTDEEMAVLKKARKVKGSHVYGDHSVAARTNRPKGDCTKTRFRSRRDALDTIRGIKYEYYRLVAPEERVDKLPRRAYRCHECRNGYHLTSKDWAPYGRTAEIIEFKSPVLVDLLLELADVA
jgi:hypothetical protein